MFAYLWGQRRAVWALAMLAVVAATALRPALAQEGDGPPAEGVSAEAVAKEIWSGAENYRSTWAIYSGITVAPGGFAREGWRLRASAGMSTYTATDALGKLRAAQPFADVLAGYQRQVGSVTLKAFAGITGYADIRYLEQALNPWGEARVGPKAAFESWWSIDPKSWAAFDVSYAAPQTFLWSRARYGWRVLPQLSLGAETGVVGDIARPGGRVGAFARFDWEQGEVALSGGVATRPGAATDANAETRVAAPYLTLLWLQKF